MKNRFLLLLPMAIVLLLLGYFLLKEESFKAPEKKVVHYPRSNKKVKRERKILQKFSNKTTDIKSKKEDQDIKMSIEESVSKALNIKEDTPVMVVEISALINSPIFEKIMTCLNDKMRETGEEEKSPDELFEKMGLDWKSDIDRLFITPEGMAVSGYFKDLKLRDNPEELDTKAMTSEELAMKGIAVVDEQMILLKKTPKGLEDALAMLNNNAVAEDNLPVSSNEIYGRFDTDKLLELLPNKSEAGSVNNSVESMLSKALTETVEGGDFEVSAQDDILSSLNLQTKNEESAEELTSVLKGLRSLSQTKISAFKEELNDKRANSEEDLDTRALDNLEKVQEQMHQGLDSIAENLAAMEIESDSSGQIGLDFALEESTLLKMMGCSD